MSEFRAPAAHGDILLVPSTGLANIVSQAEQLLQSGQLWGRSLADWRMTARAEVFELACRMTSQLFGQAPPDAFNSSWVIGGHQPELFHPGVWAKNAVIAEVAALTGSVGLNLTVDHDVCHGSSISVPRALGRHGMTELGWDAARPQMPWEERPHPSQEVFESFGDRCREHLMPWGIEPLAARQSWDAEPGLNLVDRLVVLRGRFERECGFSNLELKVSDLCQTVCFQHFVSGCIENALSLAQSYNRALAIYRERHHIRNPRQPVPPLMIGQDRVELPFWVWRPGESLRQPLFVDSHGVLTDGVRQLGPLSDSIWSQWKIRPRALSLTLFCRLCLNSVFVHGIGGAIYDQVTDIMIRDGFGIIPPPILVATATMRLFERFAGPDPAPEIEHLQQDRRAYRWNPELLVLSHPSELQLPDRVALERLSRKQLLVDAIRSVPRTQSPDERHTQHTLAAHRHAEIQNLNRAIRQLLPEDLEAVLDTRLQTLLRERPHRESLRSREFSACLFPAEELKLLFDRIRTVCRDGSLA